MSEHQLPPEEETKARSLARSVRVQEGPYLAGYAKAYADCAALRAAR